MATRSVSPGGALLRASRVFSIPQPLAPPREDLSSGAVYNSDSATLAYPTHLSITTPQASLKRGDWGFKRPLPLRSTTKTSTPFIRIKSIDTFEHVTEFGSSTDHTLSLQKWDELGVPLSTPLKPTSSSMASNFHLDEAHSGTSVFEDSIDTIAAADGKVLGKDDVRWKFDGPWLAGLTEGDFNAYVIKEVRRRKTEFRQFLRAAYAAEKTTEEQRRLTEEGEDMTGILPIKASDVTDEQLTEYIKILRRDRMSLNKSIRSFLDLPPSPNTIPKMVEDSKDAPLEEIFQGPSVQDSSDSPYAATGPPRTHPSAGLSYSRTASHTFNHPLYGPQQYQPPVLGRVIRPRISGAGNFAAVLGVGGFVVDVPRGESTFRDNPRLGKNGSQPIPGLQQVDQDAIGGSKTWLRTKHARIDAKGRVILSIARADPEAIAVKEGRIGDIPVAFTRPLSKPTASQWPSKPSSGGGYGVGRKDFAKREERADRDAVSELTHFVDNFGK